MSASCTTLLGFAFCLISLCSVFLRFHAPLSFGLFNKPRSLPTQCYRRQTRGNCSCSVIRCQAGLPKHNQYRFTGHALFRRFLLPRRPPPRSLSRRGVWPRYTMDGERWNCCCSLVRCEAVLCERKQHHVAGGCALIRLFLQPGLSPPKFPRHRRS